MARLKELREKRASAWAQAQEFNERHAAGDEMSAEDSAAWKRALDEVDELGAEIETLERTAALEERFGQIDEEHTRGAAVSDGRRADGFGDDQGGEYRSVFERFVRFGEGELNPEERQVLRAGSARAQGVGTPSAGGYTVPEGFWAKVTETLKFYATVAGVAEVLTTAEGSKVPWPTNDDTGNKGAILDENTQITELAVAFGQAELEAYMYTSRLLLVSYQLLQDAGIDIEAFLARKMGERLGRAVNEHYTVGNGVSQPQGYMTGITAGKIAGSTSAFTYEDLVDLVHSVDIAYRGNARFAVHDLVLGSIRKIKDDDGRYLWQPSMAAGVPDTILGYPYFVNNFQDAALEEGARPVVFGDFRAGFVVRNVAGGTIRRLEERYADFLQVGYFAFSRHDSVVQDASAIKYLQLGGASS